MGEEGRADASSEKQSTPRERVNMHSEVSLSEMLKVVPCFAEGQISGVQNSLGSGCKRSLGGVGRTPTTVKVKGSSTFS